jgi:hypothetical protein
MNEAKGTFASSRQIFRQEDIVKHFGQAIRHTPLHSAATYDEMTFR